MEYNTSAKGPNLELKKRLDEAARDADRLLIEKGAATADEEELVDILREYVRLRYLLKPGDISQEDGFNYLGELSLARSLDVPIDQVRKTELDSKCEGTSSSMTKKILLIIALGKALNVSTDPESNAEITTIDELARELYLGLRSGRADNDDSKG